MSSDISKSTVPSKDILEQLFLGRLHHVVTGMDKQIKDDSNESIMAWAQGIGLVAYLVPPEKIVGADPGL
jgi:hypothetical protein